MLENNWQFRDKKDCGHSLDKTALGTEMVEDNKEYATVFNSL